VKPINVLIVDDSAVIRQVITAVLSEDRAINVIGAVADPIFAMQRMKLQWPDVIVLDIEMPRMDGVTFLRKLMAERPTPVVICSTLTTRGAETTMQALSAGAVTVVEKPKVDARAYLMEASGSLIEAVKSASRANMRNLRATPQSLSATAPLMRVDANLSALSAMKETTEIVVAIGTSTGGTQALEAILSALPRVTPGIVVVQHMPEKFTAAFAQRLNELCQVEVREARDNDRVLPGLALIAPGGKQMALKRSGALYYVDVKAGPPVNRHCPSVDVLFRSVAKIAGRNALGVIMTGMGNDGAHGLKEMRDAGARTLAQDEASCVVFGMPKEAIKLDAADRVLPLQDIPREIMGAARR
jgi:two-component system, chemotaxis family, protein-glutamate methylesterase/glutaminase